MAWDFQQIQAFASQFQQDRYPGAELAFVFSEWTPEDGLGLMAAYPAAFEDIPPTEELSPAQLVRLWVDTGTGWRKAEDVATLQRVGLGTAGVLQSGIAASMVIQGWRAKGVGVGYIIAPSATMQAINQDRTAGLAVIRHYLDDQQGDPPLAADEPFTAGEVGVLSTWVNAHNITNTEFAALFDTTPAQLAGLLTSLPRWRLAQTIHDRWA